MSLISDLLDAAVTAINAGTYTVPLTAQKNYSLAMDLEQEEGIRVTVSGASETQTAEGSMLDGDDAVTMTFSLVVSAHVKSPGDEEEIDNLLDLVAALRTQVKTIPATSFILQGWESSPLYDPDLLRKDFFVSETRFTYLHPAA